MPTRTYHRVWCSDCQEFTLHLKHDDLFTCKDCLFVHGLSLLKDIPEEKILEQKK